MHRSFQTKQTKAAIGAGAPPPEGKKFKNKMGLSSAKLRLSCACWLGWIKSWTSIYV